MSDPTAAHLRARAAELIAQAGRIESAECTGLSAFWCPLHGDCACPTPEDALDDPDCPLHAVDSPHALDAAFGGAGV